MDCPHRDAPVRGRLCQHLVGADAPLYCMVFAHVGIAYELCCPACAGDSRAREDAMGFVCRACFSAVEEKGVWHSEPGLAILGAPVIAERREDVAFEHQMVRLDGVLPAPLSAVAAWGPGATFLALSADGACFVLDLEEKTLKEVGRIDVLASSLQVSPSGRMAAAMAPGEALVFDVDTCTPIWRGSRDADGPYPVCFTRVGGLERLVHEQDGALVLRCPEEGVVGTSQDDGTYRHARLLPSPSGERVAEYGWVDGPCGMVSAFSVLEWQTSGHLRPAYFGQTWRYWDGPLVWLDDRRLGVWGWGPDAESLLPALQIFDTKNGERLRWFPGPMGTLYLDGYLFSAHPDHGTSVWDVKTGERIHHDPSFAPSAYNATAKCFLSASEDGQFFVLSSLRSL